MPKELLPNFSPNLYGGDWFKQMNSWHSKFMYLEVKVAEFSVADYKVMYQFYSC